jgi:hypothetical protein
MPTVRDILTKGYFPRELPPCFSTVQFGSVVTNASGAPNAGFFGTISPNKSAELCVHNLVRSGGLRRNLGIPNPSRYALLAREVVDKWPQLHAQSHSSPFSLTKPVDTKPERSISGEHSLDERVKRRIDLRTKARVILKTDINRFYPSLYTHAIPWALHGKASVKAAKASNTLSSLWSDALDKLFRNMNDQQTVGIPIGPDCSLLIAEAVLGAIDSELVSQVPGIRGLRYIDDYEFSFDHRSQAEDTISKLQAILSHYELALNPAKTRIIELPEPFEPLWASRLRVFNFRLSTVGAERNDLTAYFDTVFTFAKADPDESIIKYAIPRLNSVDVFAENWPLYEKILSQCALVEPASLPQVCEQLYHYVEEVEFCTLNTDLWTAVLNRIIQERLPLGQSSEAAWAMWIMKVFSLQLSPESEAAINRTEDSVAALMGLFLANAGLGSPLSLASLTNFAERTGVTGRNWLLCYEGNRQGWLTPSSGSTAWPTPEFGWLYTQGVSFMNLAAVPPPPRRHTSGAGGCGGSSEDYPE